MPTYEFTCKKCDHKFTVMVSISEKDWVKCPQCSSSDLQQMFNSPFFSLGSRSGCQPPPRGGFG